ncbi:unnamed protein product [Rotaria sordida]|uniref:Uncharacterized protein n=2 Tax=Rotaria sordida TaxID=392033 RepID=A0A815IAR9_9BILA|nr:unnamed protein product [Rotaria sordida]CAF1365965.1 unnamed protein product [Rotaria sordida]CAF3820144.1 unnamed protein product [Rotaria sordida]
MKKHLLLYENMCLKKLSKSCRFANFASAANIKHADRTSKRLRNITLKPFQPHHSSSDKHKDRFNIYNYQEIAATSPISFQSPPTMFTFLPDSNPSFITSQSDSLRSTNETLEERAMRVLGPRIVTSQSVAPTPTLQESNFVHSTAFYLKAATSVQIKDLLSAGLRLSWPDLANNINDFRTDVGHEQLFMAQLASAKHILSKIDSATSIAISSKLAYQLTKLSH